jgi:hypothetical protein
MSQTQTISDIKNAATSQPGTISRHSKLILRRLYLPRSKLLMPHTLACWYRFSIRPDATTQWQPGNQIREYRWYFSSSFHQITTIGFVV